MSKAATARNIFNIIGNVITLGLFLSPVPTIYKIIKKKDVEEFHDYPYLTTILNCAFLVFFGRGMPFSHNIHIIGLVLEAVYVTIFYINFTNKNHQIKIMCCLFTEFLLLLIIGLGYYNLSYQHISVSEFIGVVSDIFNIMMYASPLTIMPKVLRTKSVKYMPFWLSVATFLNGVCWTIYALNSPIDIYVLISGGFGTISGIVQLILYYSCKEENAEKTDVVSNPTKIPF